ncbi:MAG: hypothetical protein ACQERC_02100 [Bacteroidota bacterium]
MMKLSFYTVIAATFLFVGCQKDENNDPDPSGEGSGGGNNVTSCDNLPQFADEQHQNFYSTIGSSCVTTSYYDHNQIGSATLVESDANPECSVPDTAYYKIHMGHANAEDQTVSFDVDIFFLTDVPVTAGDEYDLSENWIHAYWSFNDNGAIKQVKATEGSLVLSATDENADLEGELTFEGEEFVVEEAIDSHVKGLGEFVQNGEQVSVSAHFLAQDHGLTPDCE